MGLASKIKTALNALTPVQKVDFDSCWNAIGEQLDELTSPGMIKMHGDSTAPAGYLLCDGSAVSRTTYADLFAVIGETFGAGDGSTTFNLPDFCGIFPRGAGTNGTLGSVGGSVGDYQDFAIENITGYFRLRAQDSRSSVGAVSGVFAKTTGSDVGAAAQSGTAYAIDEVQFDASTVVNTDSETRPANLSVNFIIKT